MTNKTRDQLSEEVRAVMDRAVRLARAEGFCGEFSRVAAQVFEVPANEVVDSDGYSCRGFDQDGFNRDGWDRNGYDRDGFDSAGWDREGYGRDGYNHYGMNREGVDAQGRDGYRFDVYGFDQEGYDCRGLRRQADRDWYVKQAAFPESEFRFDASGMERPKPPKTTAEKIKSKLKF